MIQFHSDKQENLEEYKILGATIRSIINEKGVDVLRDVEVFSKELLKKKVNSIIVMQLSLLLEAGNIRNYLTQMKSGITMIDVNNMITCAEEETSLTKMKLKLLLTAVLYGLSLPTEIETLCIPQSNGEFYEEDKVIMSPSQYSPQLIEIRSAIKYENESKLMSLSSDFERLVKSGNPEALYLKGLCYKEGIGTEKDINQAVKYLVVAADAGHAEANAAMGDFYFDSSTYGLENYTKAFHYYTQIGALALSQERKNNLKVIMASKKQNIMQLILTGILLIMVFVFNQQLGSGKFSPNFEKHWGWAIVSDVLCCSTYGLVIWNYVKANYNRTKWAALAVFIITSITTFFALI